MLVPPEQNTPPTAPPFEPPTPVKRRCDNCGNWFKLGTKNPGNDKKRRFCSNYCRLMFHKNGGAYGPLKTHLENFVTSTTKRHAKPAALTAVVEITSTDQFRDELIERIFDSDRFKTAAASVGLIDGRVIVEQLQQLNKAVRRIARRPMKLQLAKPRRKARKHPRPSRGIGKRRKQPGNPLRK